MGVIYNWLTEKILSAPHGCKAYKLIGTDGLEDDFIQYLKTEVGKAYLDHVEYEELFWEAGLPRVMSYLREKHFPHDERTKKGIFGEIITMLWVRDKLGYEVPVQKRHWAMNRERSQHGEDVVGFIFSLDNKSKDKLILVESKFRLSSAKEAAKQAFKTITQCLCSDQCYSLHAIISYFSLKGDNKRCKKVKMMFDQYTSKKFIKEGGIFILSPGSGWNEDNFNELLKSKNAKNINCWAFICNYLSDLYNKCH